MVPTAATAAPTLPFPPFFPPSAGGVPVSMGVCVGVYVCMYVCMYVCTCI